MNSHELPLSMCTRSPSLPKILAFMMTGAEELLPFVDFPSFEGFYHFLLDPFYKVEELARPHSFFNLAHQLSAIVSVVPMVFVKIAILRHVS
nr:hypothetical protein [Tanacetum cinerariifolium]